jgi:molybdopterin molybdotransferase
LIKLAYFRLFCAILCFAFSGLQTSDYVILQDIFLLKMVSVNEAKDKIIANSLTLPVEIRKVNEAAGYVLASDVAAPLSLPSFRQSSMDGYAVYHEDILNAGMSLPLAGESKAGGQSHQSLDRGTAMRIFTGAPVPDGATAVIMQERAVKENGSVIINEYPVEFHSNVRRIGQQILQGEVALPAGTLLSPGSVGFLIGMNVQEVAVYRKPKVALLVTGDELARPGYELIHGQVYESNSYMLSAALEQEGIFNVEIHFAADDLPSTVGALRLLAENNDVVLASGGISVGDYDYVGKALEEIGAETIFYKVRQKPGKPLMFARSKNTLFFGLPGNPASSLVCYYEYVLPALKKMAGNTSFFLRKLKLPSSDRYVFNGERDEFLKAFATEEEVVPLDGQESFALRSFALANALIYLPVSQKVVEKGDLVEVHLLPLS